MNDPTPESDAALVRRIGEGESGGLPYHRGFYIWIELSAMDTGCLVTRPRPRTWLRKPSSGFGGRRPKWRAEAPVVHWLHKVTYNLCIDRLRKARPVSIDAVPEPPDPAKSAAAEVHQGELASAINSAIQKLPERQRAAIVMVHQEGLSNIETAEIMEISVEAVESLLARGRRGLKKSLGRAAAGTQRRYLVGSRQEQGKRHEPRRIRRSAGSLGRGPGDLAAGRAGCGGAADRGIGSRARPCSPRPEALTAVLREMPPVLASPELKARVLSDAAGGPAAANGDLLKALWPFGPIWRPALGLAAAACLGIALGITSLSGPAVEEQVVEGFGEDVLVIAGNLPAGVGQENDF